MDKKARTKKKIKYVRTSKENGCVVSSLAMITGQTFNEVLEGLKEHWNNEASYDGVDDPAWIEYLSARGYAIQDINHEYTPEDKLIENWPLEPFAPVHMCFVYAEGPHAVVMDADGRVYDGNDAGVDSLDDYKRVYRMVGIWKVREPLEIASV
jgi:hypothetical protein